MLTKPFTVGGEGTGSDPDVYALMLKNVFGVKLKLISGYPGTTEMALAVERGEVDGARELVVDQPEVAQARLDRAEEGHYSGAAQSCTSSADLKDVPLIGDFANTERQRQMLKLVLSRQDHGRGPSRRRPACRPTAPRRCGKAFDETMKDPEFARRGEGARPGGQPGERRGAR